MLECPICGEALFKEDEHGFYHEDDQATCQTCGTICWISVDESAETYVEDEAVGTAWVNTSEDVEDVGQTHCDGSCGATTEFVGTPCRWNCPRSGVKNGSGNNAGSR